MICERLCAVSVVVSRYNWWNDACIGLHCSCHHVPCLPNAKERRRKLCARRTKELFINWSQKVKRLRVFCLEQLAFVCPLFTVSLLSIVHCRGLCCMTV